MQEFIRNAPSLLVSLVVHAIVLVVLMVLKVAIDAGAPDISLESIFTEDLPREEMEQRLELDTKPAESLNVIAGGTPSTAVGATSQPASTPIDVQQADVMNEAAVEAPRVEAMQLSDEMLTAELGEGEVTGEVGAVVQGYGDAMGVITQEIMRMMRRSKVTVVWMFDESGSLEDDRKEIRENYLRVYNELGIASSQDKDLRRGSELLLTAVTSYGRGVHEHTPRPTAKVELIKKAIDSVPIDESGAENMSQSVREVLRKYKRMATQGQRKLAVILVSDESGDDGDYVEQAIVAAKEAKAPIYVLGRESMFGYPYAHQRWTYEDKAKNIKEDFWVRVRRGPETAFPEALQWNGVQARWGGLSAGFGPYEQVRMAKETGGIFFVLPGNEKNLITRGEADQRAYEFMALREYTPLLLSRREYFEQRETSRFRKAVFSVIERLNPTSNKILFQRHDPQLNLRDEHFSLNVAEFATQTQPEVLKAAKAMVLVNEAISILESVQEDRARESSMRWRAAYDLAYAQLHVFRLRQYQFLLTVDDHVNANPPRKPKDPKSNEWNIWRRRNKIEPTEEQFERLQATFGLKLTRDEFNRQVLEEEKKMNKHLRFVVTTHPNTPWARRAQDELRDGFGFKVVERLWDPSGVRRTIKVPKL